ncbi:MAG: guanylate kinase [Actinomycetota bacterium]|nr:guanylate kinase [Actinomycetota bacterium]
MLRPVTRAGHLYIVSGPSGAGKGTLVEAVRHRVPDIWVSVSATTRPPRPGEREGVEYFFLSSEEFSRLVDRGGFLEWAEVHGNRYGTLREPVDRAVVEGRPVVLEIDPQGAMQVKRAVPESSLVFVKAPSFDELKRRLVGRGSETSEQVETRLKTAEGEMAFAGTYDFVVINDDVSRATDELAAIVSGEVRRETPEKED